MMKKILISLLFIGSLFAQSELGRIDGQLKMQNEVIDNLGYGGDAALNIASGTVSGVYGVNIFARSIDGLQTTATDFWERANSDATQKIWLSPTAARLHAVISDDATDVSAMGILTLTGNIDDTKTITIGSKVYTFQSTLTHVDGNVHIGGSNETTLDNLIAAINLTISDSTDFAYNMTANEVSTLATVESGTLMNIYMDTADGTLVTEDSEGADATWGATTIALGAGARTIRIYGLKTWASKETTEDIYLKGVYTQNTANSYVTINKVEVLTKGATNINAGKISLTAASDGTITAVILEDAGTTQMGVYSFPSTQTAYITNYFVSTEEDAVITVNLLVNPNPDVETTMFSTRHGLILEYLDGTVYTPRDFNPYFKIDGPAIIKLQGTAGTNDADCYGGIGLILVDN